MKAKRRKATINAFNRTVNLMFRLNTAHESKEETKTMVRKRNHCEQTGRRRSNWLANYAKRKQQDQEARLTAENPEIP